MDYYRYSAFSLLALSQKCDTYNFQSEIFFKVLLRFPNLHLSLWANIDSNNVTANSTSPINNFKFNIPSGSLPAVLEDAVAPNMKSPYIALGEYTPPPPTLGQLPSSCILSIEERQEVSLLYIINYLLRISSLVELVNPSTTFNQELNFLIANLLTNLSLFIQKSVSVVSMYLTLQDDDRSSSAGSGAGNVNLSDTSVMCKSISSILFHGTYKERLTGVINFLESIRKDTIHIPTILSRYLPLDSFNGDEMAVESDFERLATNIDDVKYPGKIKYIDVIHRIACRIRSVSFCHWLKTSGVNNIPEHQLKRFYYSDAEQVVTDSFLQKAKALQFRLGRSEKILEVKQVQLNEVNIGKNILEQLEIHRANAQLDSSSSRLTNYIK